mmetsp:Transcript_39992/g.80676  ORF Transcript_39992/g.80676 Transcript_39992/m.80676 type:complete len:220 (-) Transcript_39992:388-1047(-)
MASQQWAHVGWMSKQGHKYTSWKNRYFVLTEESLSYYKEDVSEETAHGSSALAGTITLLGAVVYPTCWAPEGMFGWMVVTAEGIKYPFRCFGLKDRETWLRKVNAAPGISVSTEELAKEETSGAGLSAFGFRPLSTTLSGKRFSSFSLEGLSESFHGALSGNSSSPSSGGGGGGVAAAAVPASTSVGSSSSSSSTNTTSSTRSPSSTPTPTTSNSRLPR